SPSISNTSTSNNTSTTTSTTGKTVKQNSEETSNIKWHYKDPRGEIQGPFGSTDMNQWLIAGFFNIDLAVKRSDQTAFIELGKLFLTEKRNPFTGANLFDFFKQDPQFHPFKQHLLQLQ